MKFKKLIATMLALLMTKNTAYANFGDIGFFGGISEGRKLPKTTESMLDIVDSNGEFVYKEMIMIDKQSYEYTGIIKVSETPEITDDLGSYKYTMQVMDSDTTPTEISINRNISFLVNYRRENGIIVKDYEITSHKETIQTPSGTYTLDTDQSYFGVSLIEDVKPGITYYKASISKQLVYLLDGDNENPVYVSESGSMYGYSSPYSSTETYRTNVTVNANDYDLQYQVRPSTTVRKVLNYSENEPTLISFDGNYQEVITNESGLRYDYLSRPSDMYLVPLEGGATIRSYNSFEQLIPPSLDFLKGHWAYSDISKLFSLGVLVGETSHFIPNQAITRGQYTDMLARAIKLDAKEYENAGNNKQAIKIAFGDVTEQRKEYPQIMAAYDSGLAIGRADGLYYPDGLITRQEAIVILLRTIGLENLGLDPTPMTSFVDDENIADWAKKEIYAAERIGLVSKDLEGKINPTAIVSKAEAAALTNRLIDYMRYDMEQDYAANIVNFYSNK